MRNKTITIRLGGGKTSVKLITYVCLLSLIVITIFITSSQNIVNAAPKKGRTNSSSKSKNSAKRAATTTKSSKKNSSTNKNTKRAAVSNSNSATKTSSANNKRVPSTKRAVSRTAPKAKPTTTSGNSNTNTASKITVCPIGAFLKMTSDDNGNDIFYSSKKTECLLRGSELMDIMTWKKEDKATYSKALQTKPSWISESEAVFLTCIPGYVEKTVNKVKTCVKDEEETTEKQATAEEITKEQTEEETTEKQATAEKVVSEQTEKETVKEEPVKEEPVENTPQLSEEELAEKLAKLRIKKVEGTADDYTCIKGWTNNWDVFNNKNNHCRNYFVKKALIMDKDGKIKNEADRNTYGKNKRGCPIRLDGYNEYSDKKVKNTFFGLISTENFNSNNSCIGDAINTIQNTIIYPPKDLPSAVCSFGELPRKAQLGLLKTKMTISNIDNTGEKGWTEEEYKAWNGYRPIFGFYYDDFSIFEGKTKVDNCDGKDDSYYTLGVSKEVEEQILKSNLFTYWD